MSESQFSVAFLTKETVLVLHEMSLKQYGGDVGIRDHGLLESALAQPQSGIASGYLHRFPFEMAAAYGFHLARNHPFFDGNKRTAWLAANLFLELNGWELSVAANDAVAMMLAVAAGETDKSSFATWIEAKSRCRS